jgi:photosystem II stability/assembly factor-like uncharacterized protein
MRRICLFALMLFIITNLLSYSQWEQLIFDKGIYAINTNDKDIFFGASDYHLYYSSDNGLNFKVVNSFNASSPIWNITIKYPHIYIGTGGDGFYVSHDYGNSWSNVEMIRKNIKAIEIRGFILKDNLIYSATDNGLFVSSDNGDSWEYLKVGEYGTSSIKSIVQKDNHIIIGSNGIYLSNDNGLNWRDITGTGTDFSIGTSHLLIQWLAVVDSVIFVITNNHKLYSSTDLGNSWSSPFKFVKDTSFHLIWSCGKNLYATGEVLGLNPPDGCLGVLYSSNYGKSWSIFKDRLGNTCTGYSAFNEEYLFVTVTYAGFPGNGLFRSRFKDCEIIGLTNEVVGMPKDNPYGISPNPSSNTITLSYPDKMYGEQIKIFNTMGITVWSGIADAESKTIDISGLAAGAYFLRIGKETGIFIKE